MLVIFLNVNYQESHTLIM